MFCTVPVLVKNCNREGAKHGDAHNKLGARPTPGQVLGVVEGQVGQRVDLGNAIRRESSADMSCQT